MNIIIKKYYEKLRLFIYTIVILVAILFAYDSLTIPKEKVTFFLSSSDTDTVLRTLAKHGIYTYDIDKYVLHCMTRPKIGWYCIGNSSQKRLSFFKTFYQKHIPSMRVKLYAGETSTELTTRLANDIKLDKKSLLQLYKRYSTYQEGDILAGEYTIARKIDEHTLMKFLYQTSRSMLDIFIEKNFTSYPSDKKLKEIFTIASIIQKESNNVKEMPLISSVIHNRLKKNMRLQMDGTLNYGPYAHTVVTPERIKNDESLYNTYKHKGLPPTPLSTVSIEALEAALKPKKTPYLFFMLTPDGTHTFAQTYKKHLTNIRSFREAIKENNTTDATADTENS